jgi:hypothetical protein
MPLEFGSRATFQKALTELRYLEKMHGKLRKNDFNQVAEKYKFPIDFLNQGLKGLSFPDDLMISKSKWFPILYRWAVDNENAIRRLTILTTQYLRACFLRILAPVYATIAFFLMGVGLYVVARLTFLEIFLVLILPAILFIIPLFWEFHMRVVQCQKELEDHKAIMKDEGMTDVVLRFAQFAIKHTPMVLFAGHVLASKPLLNFFKMGIVKTKDGALPAFYAENPHLDYRTRLSKFLDIKEKVE